MMQVMQPIVQVIPLHPSYAFNGQDYATQVPISAAPALDEDGVTYTVVQSW